MKILHILDHSLPVQSGYAFRSAAILHEQGRLGWHTVQLTGPKHGMGGEPAQWVDDILYHRTPAVRSWLNHMPAGDPLNVIRCLRRSLRDLVARERPDIVHAHSPCLNAMAAVNLGLPLVYEMRSSWEDAAVSTGTTVEGSLRYRASRALETWVLRRADAVITICDGLRREVIARGVPAERITIVSNAVNIEASAPSAASAGGVRRALGVGEAFVIGFIGTLFAWEGLALLLEALPAILARRPDVHLLLVGEGVHQPALRSLAARLGLDDKVTFAGQVPHERVSDFYDAIDLLVYPRMPMRLTDMVTPLKPLEAMARGKALIASDVGGHRELIEDGTTGILFEAGKTEALTDAVLRVAGEPILAARLGENSRRFVRQHRTWAQVVSRYEPVYRKLIRCRQP